MNELQLLTWTRGPGLSLAVGIFLLGVLWRLIEIYTLGRKKDLAAPRRASGASGLHTVFRRSLPPQGMLKRSPVSYIGGYIFHIGLAIIVLLSLMAIAAPLGTVVVAFAKQSRDMAEACGVGE